MWRRVTAAHAAHCSVRNRQRGEETESLACCDVVTSSASTPSLLQRQLTKLQRDFRKDF
jgi:hypothetical protein